MSRPQLEKRNWARYLKHRKATLKNWELAVDWTIQGDAQYHPNFDDDAIEQLERKCILEGTIIRERPHIKKFYLLTDSIVGACSGEVTNYVFAEWKDGGTYHGRPISKKRLREMGVKIDDQTSSEC